MKRLYVLLLFGLFMTSPAAASVRSQIQTQYRRWARATLANDAEAILNGLAPAYTLKTFTGKVIDRKTYEQSLRKRKANPGKPLSSYTTRMASIEVLGPRAHVISEESSSSKAVDPITQKRIRLVHIHQYLDTWVKSARSWLLQSTVTQKEITRVERT